MVLFLRCFFFVQYYKTENVTRRKKHVIVRYVRGVSLIDFKDGSFFFISDNLLVGDPWISLITSVFMDRFRSFCYRNDKTMAFWIWKREFVLHFVCSSHGWGFTTQVITSFYVYLSRDVTKNNNFVRSEICYCRLIDNVIINKNLLSFLKSVNWFISYAENKAL